jgi:protein SCO1/2
MIPRSRPRTTTVKALLLALSLVGATLAASGGLGRAHAAAEQSPPPQSGLFTLTTLDGSTVTDETYRGKWLVIYFGYTFCPDDCPTTLSSIGAALEAIGPLADKVQPLFITTDPARDKAPVMTAYLKAFDPRIIGLRGAPEQIDGAVKQFHVHYRLQRFADGGYGFDHTGFLYLVNPEGKLAARLELGEKRPGQQLADELRKLVK